MSDDQIAELISYLRQQFAPNKPAWIDLHAAVGRIRERPLN
jgi:nicotinate dehydrogenase subunit B